MSNFIVSIIIPVYNSKEYLTDCVKSAERQIYPNTEIILIDDGSTDGSYELCDLLASKYMNIVVIHQQNSGVSAARNVGITAAKGKYIVFCDSDDLLAPEMLKELVAAKEIYPEYLPVCGISKQSGDNGRTDYLLDGDEFIKVCKKDFFVIQKCQLFNAPVNKLYEKEIILANNLKFNTDITLGEDLIFNADYVITSGCNFIVVNKPLYFYNTWIEESLSKKYTPDILKNYIAIKEKLDELINFTHADMSIYSKRYSTILLYNIVNAIKNTMSYKNTDSVKKKIEYIENILKAFDVKYVVSRADCSAYNSFYLRLLCLGNAKFIYIFRKMKKQ